MLHDAIICRHFTLGDGGDRLGIEFPEADSGPITVVARPGTIPPDCDSTRLSSAVAAPTLGPSN
jgi:hypothetical protein